MKKLKFAVLWAICLLLILAAYAPELDYWQHSPSRRLEVSIAADLKTLATQGKLPPVWQDIQKVDWSSDASNTLFEYNAPTFPVALNMQGNKTLNILCVQWVDYPQYGALVRYSLLDEKQNLVFELNRHYKIGFIY